MNCLTKSVLYQTDVCARIIKTFGSQTKIRKQQTLLPTNYQTRKLWKLLAGVLFYYSNSCEILSGSFPNFPTDWVGVVTRGTPS